MKIFKPFQLGVQTQVIKQNNNFYLSISSTIGTHLGSGESLIEPDWLKLAMDGMGELPLPDTGMPKPSGEFLVSGKFYAPNGEPVEGGQVRVQIGDQEKNLLVFGPRQWVGGLPSTPQNISSLPIDYKYAFGGSGFEKNPDGIGFDDQQLPQIEIPDQLVTSPKSNPDLAGFSTVNPGLPQRVRFQGTYDNAYMEKYFPGYPEDFDWRYFHCAPPSQWHSEYYQGHESIEIQNMHPEEPVVSGRLPGFQARCFVTLQNESTTSQFTEWPMNLDTIWVFPEQELVLQIWRCTQQVSDDDASEIQHVLAAYEKQSDSARSVEHYQSCLRKRLESDDPLLNNFKTRDIIPEGHKSAMTLLMDDALSNVGEDSELSKNLNAKSEMAQQHVAEQLQDVKNQVANTVKGVTDEQGQPLPDLEKLLKSGDAVNPDPDVEWFKLRMEQILPGLTSGDPKKIDFDQFSFDIIDDIMAAQQELTDRKQAVADQELIKMKAQVSDQLQELERSLEGVPEQDKDQLKRLLDGLDSIDADSIQQKSPLPRLDAQSVVDSASPMDPEAMQAMLQVDTLKSMGVDDEQTRQLEDLLGNNLHARDDELAERLKTAERDFRELYLKSAHFMDDGIPPHHDHIDEKARQLLDNPRDAAEKDWSGIDLSGQNLEGINLSGAYLEQVDFSGASLVGANLSGAILARARLDYANLTNANLEGANIGGVSAFRANFTNTNCHQAVLSKGKFDESDFSKAILTEVESLEVSVNRCEFRDANLTGIKFIDREIVGTDFTAANLEASVFLQSSLNNVVFDNSLLARCVWADTSITNCRFVGATISANCFAFTEEAKEAGRTEISGADFSAANIQQSSFQNVSMPGSRFIGASALNCNFNGADLSDSNLQQADMRQSQFRNTKLTRSILTESNFSESFFSRAHLVSSDLSGSNLYGVDFLGTTVGETRFSGCNLDATILKDWRPS